MLHHTELGDGEPVLMVHGFPESSYMWRDLMEPVAAAGWRAVAPDLLGFGDSPLGDPSSWEAQVEALGEFHSSGGLGQVVLCVHDWGGLIGLRWACENPESIRALIISASGFFSDGKWHGLADVMRAPGDGEALVEGLTEESLGALLTQSSPGIGPDAVAEYWKGFEGGRGRGALELYRSGDFEKLVPYEGKLAALGVPALLLWGETDPFAPVAGAKRFESELPDTRLVVVEGAGHFVFEDAPDECARAVTGFLAEIAP
ncbi:MAG: alpha/beta fold hydrolase [Thermoleophilaceae bacterium]|nr:alpha/beta fold hydrolase [Thermoleophilaceae bacterium]